MGRIALDPYGAPEITPNGWELFPTVRSGEMTGCDGKNGTKCFFLWIKINRASINQVQ